MMREAHELWRLVVEWEHEALAEDSPRLSALMIGKSKELRSSLKFLGQLDREAVGSRGGTKE